ncbi:unnamed protein product [Gongylonema pulchrum]|uniref:Titin n=1 Tax=Gongylonema pulchrum TaxID=637853 RepID=A0A183ENZ8_9BILA|nr:unnamed protein product [Gongylonema pulchrum]
MVHTPVESSEYETITVKRNKASVRKPAKSTYLNKTVDGDEVLRLKVESSLQKAGSNIPDDNEYPREVSETFRNNSKDSNRDASDQQILKKHVNSNEKISGASSKAAIKKPGTQVTDEYGIRVHSDVDITKFEEIPLNKTKTEESVEETITNEFGFPVHTRTDEETGRYQVLDPEPMFSVDERITNEDGWEVHSRVPTDDFQTLNTTNIKSDESKILVVHHPTSSEEADEASEDTMISETFVANQTENGSEGEKSTEKGTAKQSKDAKTTSTENLGTSAGLEETTSNDIQEERQSRTKETGERSEKKSDGLRNTNVESTTTKILGTSTKTGKTKSDDNRKDADPRSREVEEKEEGTKRITEAKFVSASTRSPEAPVQSEKVTSKSSQTVSNFSLKNQADKASNSSLKDQADKKEIKSENVNLGYTSTGNTNDLNAEHSSGIREVTATTQPSKMIISSTEQSTKAATVAEMRNSEAADKAKSITGGENGNFTETGFFESEEATDEPKVEDARVLSGSGNEENELNARKRKKHCHHRRAQRLLKCLLKHQKSDQRIQAKLRRPEEIVT